MNFFGDYGKENKSVWIYFKVARKLKGFALLDIEICRFQVIPIVQNT